MKVNSARFLTSAARDDQYPPEGLPEIAFAGRSNVGKSSLINSLTGRKGLVKVSQTPGKTRLLNFFVINETLVFVDMPGYGFAKVPVNVRKSWGNMVEAYLAGRESLKAVVVILDARRTPNEDDLALLEWLAHYGVPAIVVFTKIDKIPKTRRARRIREAMAALGAAGESLRPIVYSSLTGEGKRQLWAALRDAAGA
ncbi:MAG: ribosome biogenesis GTP-binding protein YihA/YsxC [Candidatus Nitrospinota bacterium M3_3B_026]